ncbi:MAG TPA: NAD(P)/FAD-dependent oxidoreductase [Bdellovibrionota bacterium]|nr:NAD(P)/FAD-dependent oxidoreductase [Bdellovibrionota bacterium]
MRHDVLILGAGGAGMMCAAQAARRGRDVLLIDHSKKLGGKILISGGGRCNFTNTGASPANYVSKNPHFCKSALSRYPAENFIQLVQAHGIAFHEKKLGQLFCDESAQQIVDLLKAECDEAGAKFALECKVESVSQAADPRFQVVTSMGTFECDSLVVATGGLSIPKIGATDLGYRIAEQFGLKLVAREPALDGFVFGPEEQKHFGDLAGLSIDCVMSAGGKSFRENLLFTHTGLSGPASLQASLHWYSGDPISIDLTPELDPFAWFLAKKKEGDRRTVKNILCEALPSRFAERFSGLHFPFESPLPQVSERALEEFCARLKSWSFVPARTVGYGKAEVTRGGVDTDELSSKTMESKKVPGLYFIGEVVDVTGWLGGYNFQWAWASGWAAGQVV